MNQTIRVIFATILVALSFTHSANADAQQKFSFQGVSFNGDIKAEQFNFSDVMVIARSNTDRVNIKVIFQDVSTPYKVTDKDEAVSITFEGDPESETVYAIRLHQKALKMENLTLFMSNSLNMTKLNLKVHATTL